MIKRLVIFNIVVVILFAIMFFSHTSILSSKGIELNMPLLGMYIFHAISSIIIYLLIEAVYLKLPNQTGFAYLASVFVKIGFFILLFASNIYGDEPLAIPQKLSIVIPFFTFLIVEAVFSFRLLNKD